MSDEKKPRQRGQIIPLGGGKFKIAVPLGTKPDGSRPYHNETLRNSTEAKAWKRVNAILAEVDAGTYFTASKQTISELMEEWIDRLRRRGLKESTIEAYTSQVNNHVKPQLGAIMLSKLSAEHIQKFYDRLQDEDYSPVFIRMLHQRLKSALDFSRKRMRIKVNPADLVELPPMAKPKKAIIFDEEEALAFIEAARRVPDDIMFVFVLLTGLRPSEFFGITYPDLHLVKEGEATRGRVDITRQIARRRGGEWYFSTPKTPSSVRSIYFPASLYYELMAHEGEQVARLKKLGHIHQLVFTNERGEPFSRGTAQRRFNAVCQRAGLTITGRSLYTLRRSHATLSLLAGESLKSLSERMGHVSVEFTQDEYMDVLPVMQQMAADKLEQRLLGTNLADFDSPVPM
jgi:integrase